MVEAYSEKGGVFDPEDERRRLGNLFPARVSSALIAEATMTGVNGIPRILDVACGPNPILAGVVASLGGKYTGLDLDPGNAHLINLKNKGVDEVVRGDALSLPFGNGSVHISHTRAFLAFLNFEQRDKAIGEIIRVTEKVASLLSMIMLTLQIGREL